MVKNVLKVEGMSCNHCKMAIEKALREIEVSATVNLEEKTVTVEYDPGKTDPDKIRDKIEDEGYEVIG